MTSEANASTKSRPCSRSSSKRSGACGGGSADDFGPPEVSRVRSASHRSALGSIQPAMRSMSSDRAAVSCCSRQSWCAIRFRKR